MNRMTLLLNGVILIVTFLVALSATDSQVGLLRSASASQSVRRSSLPDTTAPAFLRVVQSLENFLPPKTLDNLSTEQLDTIHEAVRRYYLSVRAAVAREGSSTAKGRELLRAYGNIGRSWVQG